jgi:hypothetical protein
MPQTFEDLTVEKEVAIRRRIAKEYEIVSSLLGFYSSLSGSISGVTIFQIFARTMII